MAKGNGRFPPLNALRAFEAAARHSSFKIAAQELHVTPRAREDMCSLTVVAPPNFAARWLVPRLARFTTAHPNIELHLASRQAMVDGRENGHALVPEADTRPDSPVAMVRFGSGHYPGSHVDEVFSAVYVPVCSPRLLKGPHPLRKPEDLRSHTLLHDDTVIEEGARPSWNDWLQSVGVTDIDATRGPHFSDAALAMDAAIEGLGVTLAIRSLVKPEIEAGRLVVPFDIAAQTGYAYYLVTPEATTEDGAVAAFREWLLDEAKEEQVIAIRSSGSAATGKRRRSP